MYVGIDIGGTKILVATLDDQGIIQQQHKFPTPPKYEDLLENLCQVRQYLEVQTYRAGGIGIPGSIDRENGISLTSPNIPWRNVPIRDDCVEIFGCPFVVENDANLAALSEAMLHKDRQTVLYFTISTGIGTGFIRDQQIEPTLLKMEGGHIVLPNNNGKLEDWENFGSGRAIYHQLGKKAADITDETDWKLIARNLSLGFFNNIAILQPDLVVVGGSVGAYFDHYGGYLVEELKHYGIPIVPIPEIIGAQRPEQAVIYGCYDLAKQIYGDGKADS